MTSHAAFGYLAARYGLHQIAITGIDPESEPSARKLASLAQLVRSLHIDTVFFERLVSPQLAETVAREAGVHTAVLDPIEGLTPSEADAGATYLSLMRQNLGGAPAGARMPVALELEDVDFAYTPGNPVLTGVDLRVESGEFVAIAGPNGGGKTTLLRLALGLERPTRGEVRLFGEPARSVRRPPRGSATSRSARTSACTRPRPCARWSRRAARRCARSGGCAARTARRPTRRSSASGSTHLASRPRARASPAGSSSARSSRRRWPRGRRCSCSTSRPPASTSRRRKRSRALLDRLHSELGVTILYVSHEFGAVEHFVHRLVLVRERIVFDGAPNELPGMWHDPSHAHA